MANPRSVQGDTFVSLCGRLWRGVRQNGATWLLQRALKEVRSPYTALGRVVNAGIRLYEHKSRSFRLVARVSSHAGDTLTAFYDLLVEPATFDAMWFLLAAERVRRTRGLASLHVVFVSADPGITRDESRDYDQVVNADSRRDRILNILVPLAWLVPTVRNIEIVTDRNEAHARLASRAPDRVFPPKYSVRLHRSCSLDCYRDVLRRPSPEAVNGVFQARPSMLDYVDRWLEAHGGGRRAVSITVRYYSYNPARNSNIDAWTRVAAYLKQRGYLPVIIPDTESLAERIPDALFEFPCMPEAAWTLGIRLALYERAFMNLGINNGPAFLFLTDSRARGIMFKIITPGVPQNEAEYIASQGFEIGGQIPFVGPFQKRVWEDDDFDVIRREFEAMECLIEAETRRWGDE